MKSESSLSSRNDIARYLGREPRTVELRDAKLGYVDLAAAELRLRGKMRDRAIVLRTKALPSCGSSSSSGLRLMPRFQPTRRCS